MEDPPSTVSNPTGRAYCVSAGRLVSHSPRRSRTLLVFTERIDCTHLRRRSIQIRGILTYPMIVGRCPWELASGDSAPPSSMADNWLPDRRIYPFNPLSQPDHHRHPRPSVDGRRMRDRDDNGLPIWHFPPRSAIVT